MQLCYRIYMFVFIQNFSKWHFYNIVIGFMILSFVEKVLKTHLIRYQYHFLNWLLNDVIILAMDPLQICCYNHVLALKYFNFTTFCDDIYQYFKTEIRIQNYEYCLKCDLLKSSFINFLELNCLFASFICELGNLIN